MSGRVWPVFLPFAGCPYRCAFCAQDKQTGRGDADLEAILRELETNLDEALAAGRGPYELAFYGGTFTALPDPWPHAFLAVGQRYRERGLITRIRCSTRPDCVGADQLALLGAMGLDMVELGIQSFDDAVLMKSGRGYTGETAARACELVKESGMTLGVQLLPGLPGDRPGVFQQDIRRTAEIVPAVARIYPCLVIEGTPLAERWKHGDFQPWGIERTRTELAQALPVLWEAGIHIIRLGLPPEGTLDEHILAGPHHPALGQSARGLALFHFVKAHVRKLNMSPTLLEVPRRYQGELMGHARELAKGYEGLGLNKQSIRYTSDNHFTLR